MATASTSALGMANSPNLAFPLQVVQVPAIPLPAPTSAMAQPASGNSKLRVFEPPPSGAVLPANAVRLPANVRVRVAHQGSGDNGGGPIGDDDAVVVFLTPSNTKRRGRPSSRMTKTQWKKPRPISVANWAKGRSVEVQTVGGAWIKWEDVQAVYNSFATADETKNYRLPGGEPAGNGPPDTDDARPAAQLLETPARYKASDIDDEERMERLLTSFADALHGPLGEHLERVEGHNEFFLWESCAKLWRVYIKEVDTRLLSEVHSKAIGTWLRDRCDRAFTSRLCRTTTKLNGKRQRVGRLTRPLVVEEAEEAEEDEEAEDGCEA